MDGYSPEKVAQITDIYKSIYYIYLFTLPLCLPHKDWLNTSNNKFIWWKTSAVLPPGAAVISVVIFDVCVIWQVSCWEGSSYTVRTTDVVATSLTLAVGGAVALAVEALLGVRTPGEQDDEQIIYNRHLLKIWRTGLVWKDLGFNQIRYLCSQQSSSACQNPPASLHLRQLSEPQTSPSWHWSSLSQSPPPWVSESTCSLAVSLPPHRAAPWYSTYRFPCRSCSDSSWLHDQLGNLSPPVEHQGLPGNPVLPFRTILKWYQRRQRYTWECGIWQPWIVI